MGKELININENIYFFNDNTWVDLTDLDLTNEKFKWSQSTNKKIKFKGKNNFGEYIIGEFIILKVVLNKHHNYQLTVLYNNKEYNILRSSVVNANFQNLLHREFKYEIGTTFNDEKGNITIIDRKSLSKRKRLYKYHCNKCGYEDWKFEINFEKGGKTRCSCCCSAPKVVVSEINDIPTMAPWMIKYFPGGYDEAKLYTYGSGKEIDFVCPDCGNIKKMEIHTLYENGFSCSCHGHFSYPERFFEEFLKQLKINYKRQLSRKDFNWIENYLYDFYLYDYDTIIETHGSQHYVETTLTQRTLFEEQENDRLKERLAKSNKIQNYIILDCRKSEIEWIKNSIMNSNLPKLLNFTENNIDWDLCDKKALGNKIREISEFYEFHKFDMQKKEIAKYFNISVSWLMKLLKKGDKYGWCSYKSDGKTIVRKEKDEQINIIQDGKLLGIYRTPKEIENISVDKFGVKLNKGTIRQFLNGNYRCKTYKGFEFIYNKL